MSARTRRVYALEAALACLPGLALIPALVLAFR